MKKLLVIILALTLMLALASCDLFKMFETEHNVHTDNNNDGFCDGCGAVFIDYSQPSVVGDALMESLEKQLSEMKSFKFELELQTISESDYWMYDEYYDYELGEYVTETTYHNDGYYSENIVSLEVWVSFDNDTINAKMTANAGYRYDKTEEIEYDDPSTAYIVDGYMYTPLNGKYYEKEALIPEELEELLNQLPEMGDFTEAEKDEFLEELGVEIATVFNIKDNKGSYSFDAKPAIDKFYDYLNKLDMKKDTVSKLVDDVLKQISPELKSAEIVAELERLADLSVAEALDELDAWLTENYDTTIQGIYDSLFTDPELAPMMEMYLASMQGLNPENPADKAALDELIAELKAINLKQYLKEQGSEEVYLFDLFASAYLPRTEDPATGEYTHMSKEEFFGQLKELLNMTLGEFDEMSGGAITELKELPSALKINQLNAKIDLNFEGVLSLVSIDGQVNFDIETNSDSQVAGKKDYNRSVLKATVKLSEISSETVELSLPKDIKVLESKTYEIEGYEDSFASVSYRGYYDGTINADFDITLYDTDGTKYRFSADCDYNAFGNKYTTSVYSLSINDEWYSFSGKITFAFDAEAGTFRIIELPNFDLLGGDFYNGEDSLCVTYSDYSDYITVYFQLNLYDDYGNEIYIFESIDVNETSNEYTVTVDYFHYNDEIYWFDYDEYQTITFVLDRSTMSFTITEMPDWSLALD